MSPGWQQRSVSQAKAKTQLLKLHSGEIEKICIMRHELIVVLIWIGGAQWYSAHNVSNACWIHTAEGGIRRRTHV